MPWSNFVYFILQHIFHETCILPWLELHGTCPICRDTFTEGGEQEQGDDAGYEAMDTDTPNRFDLISDMQQSEYQWQIMTFRLLNLLDLIYK